MFSQHTKTNSKGYIVPRNQVQILVFRIFDIQMLIINKFSTAKSIIHILKAKKFPLTTQIMKLKYVLIAFAAPNYVIKFTFCTEKYEN